MERATWRAAFANRSSPVALGRCGLCEGRGDERNGEGSQGGSHQRHGDHDWDDYECGGFSSESGALLVSACFELLVLAKIRANADGNKMIAALHVLDKANPSTSLLLRFISKFRSPSLLQHLDRRSCNP